MPKQAEKLTKLSKGKLTVETSVPAEVVRLKAQGWAVQGEGKASASNGSGAQSASNK